MSAPRRHFDIEQLALLDSDMAVSEPPASTRPSDTMLDFLALLGLKGLGRYSLQALYDRFVPLNAVWEVSPQEIERVLKTAGNRQAKQLSEAIAHRSSEVLDAGRVMYDGLVKHRVTVLFRDDATYPKRLREADGPRWLFVQGSVELLAREANVAVVGTREPSNEGLELAREAAALLARSGYVVTSGLAQGIDSEAHETTLDLGGKAIAVLGNGLNIEFPAGSRNLHRRIVRHGGAVVTEYLWNESYSRQSFVERNRIQAALAGAVLPIECRRKSGTAHTIRFAVELRKKLFGLRLSEFTQVGNNDVYQILSELAAPIFNLSNSASRDALNDFLKPIANDLQPPPDDSELIWRRTYAEVFRGLKQIVGRRRPTPAEWEWVLVTLRRMNPADRSEN